MTKAFDTLHVYLCEEIAWEDAERWETQPLRLGIPRHEDEWQVGVLPVPAPLVNRDPISGERSFDNIQWASIGASVGTWPSQPDY